MDFENALQILNNTAGVLALFVSVLAYGQVIDVENKKNSNLRIKQQVSARS